MKKFIGNVLLQIIPVMIGVYLGFALNNYGEKQKLKKETATYKEMLRNEISSNLDAVNKVFPYHQQLSKDISGILKSDDIQKTFKSYRFTGLRPAFVNRSAYNTGIQTGIIQEFSLNSVQDLNRLYTLQEKYNSFNESMISSFQSQKFPETAQEIKSMLINMSMNMNDVKSFEQQLQERYELFLEQKQ